MNGSINPLGLISSRRVLPIAFISLLFSASCASMQDDRLVSAGDSATTDRLASVEEAVVRIDSLSGAERSEAIAAAREKIDALYLLNVEDTVFQSRLHAWSGRLFLAAGKRSEAAKRYDAAVRLLPSDIPSSILGARLEKTGEAGLARIDGALSVDPGEPRLLAERALYAERLGRYSESVAAFDAAFSRLPPYYRETYTINRDRSWEFRASGSDSLLGEDIARILASPAATWQDAIVYTLATTGLLDFATAGKSAAASKLFPKLVASGTIPLREGAPAPAPEDSLSRSDLAWFVWHALAESRSDKTMLTKYSRRWASVGSGASPIPDVGIESPYFDSVMGCVETEIMALPDGRSFHPLDAVRGADLARIVGRAAK
ncbi:MAG TPA: hypothetical protein PL077_03935 [Treponemataceae bacterium]|nr:hypothetical protein [Treponemataceae bacterium]